MREYVALLATLATLSLAGLAAGAAEPLQDHVMVAMGNAVAVPQLPRPAAGNFFVRIITTKDNPEDGHLVRQQREVQGLFPFPRVGRATWPLAGLGENKRQGLIPFPRVGRSENADPRAMPATWLVAPEYYPGKRVGSSWVPSPRLGRQNKRFESDNGAWTLVNLREYPAMNRPQRGRDSASFTPRLGRELESDEEVQGPALGPPAPEEGPSRL